MTGPGETAAAAPKGNAEALRQKGRTTTILRRVRPVRTPKVQPAPAGNLSGTKTEAQNCRKRFCAFLCVQNVSGACPRRRRGVSTMRPESVQRLDKRSKRSKTSDGINVIRGKEHEPMISVFSDRIEILSRGTLAPAQTMEGFFLGESIPVNEKLSEIFLQLHISEKSGRGVPKITEMYGKDAFSFRENSIVVTIPFERINKVGNKVGKKVGDKKPLNSRRQKIIAEMRDNPNITTAELHNILGVSETAVENNISFLRENGYIERVGSKKAGYWKVL